MGWFWLFVAFVWFGNIILAVIAGDWTQAIAGTSPFAMALLLMQKDAE